MSFQIRPFQSEDTSALVAFHNLVEPEYPQTEAEFRWGEEHREARIKHARWVAFVGDCLVGEGEYGQDAGLYHPQRFYLGVGVLPDYRRQGIGSALYDTVISALAAHDPNLFHTSVRENRPDGLQFVGQRGYVETMREWESRLDVSAFDPTPFHEHQVQFASGEIRIQTMAELAADPNRNEKLYHLENALEKDVPTAYEQTPRPFEEWQKRTFDNPWLLPDAWFIAVDGDQYVGYSALGRTEAGPWLDTGLTGVLRSHRRRGIALAMKLRAIEYARSVAAPEIRTWNATTNEGMLSINIRLGFVRQPAWIEFEKRLRPDE